MTGSDSHVVELLLASGRFAGIARDTIESAVAAGTRRSHRAGDVLRAEGERDGALVVVVSGAVQTFAGGVVLARLGAGALLGARDERAAGARAVADTDVLSIPADAAARLRPPSRLVATLLADDALRAAARERAFAPGETLFRAGEAAGAFYVVLAGTAAVYRESESGRELVVRLGPGRGLGELALVRRQPRAATVVAEDELRALVVDGDAFLDLLGRSPELQRHVGALERSYTLPELGVATQRIAIADDHECIATTYELPDGRRFAARRALDDERYELERVVPAPRHAPFELTWSEGVRERRLRFDGDALVGLVARGAWDELGRAHALVLGGETLDVPAQAAFRRTGSLAAPRDEPGAHAADELVCYCMEVRESVLRDAVRAGAGTIEELSERTGAGTVCGSCVPELMELVGGPDWLPVVVDAIEDVTADVRALRLRPIGRAAPDAFARSLPGQHVVVEARIDGRPVQRPYTLVSAAGATAALEIAVKREPRGSFSSWVFDALRTGGLLRVSSPRGTFVPPTDPAAPVAFLVAGIGVTPALAVARSAAAAGASRPVLVHLSATRADELPFAAELAELAARHRALVVETRATEREGRLGDAAVAALVRRAGPADWYVCGPAGYRAFAAQALARAGVGPERIRVEVFTPQGAPL